MKATDTLIIEIKRKLSKVKARRVRLVAHPDVCKYLREGKLLDRWHRLLRLDIRMEEDKTLHVEEYKIES